MYHLLLVMYFTANVFVAGIIYARSEDLEFNFRMAIVIGTCFLWVPFRTFDYLISLYDQLKKRI